MAGIRIRGIFAGRVRCIFGGVVIAMYVCGDCGKGYI